MSTKIVFQDKDYKVYYEKMAFGLGNAGYVQVLNKKHPIVKLLDSEARYANNWKFVVSILSDKKNLPYSEVTCSFDIDMKPDGVDIFCMDDCHDEDTEVITADKMIELLKELHKRFKKYEDETILLLALAEYTGKK
jgi:hypothetical protein